MRIPYSTNVRCEKTGIALAYDFECELDVALVGDSIRVDAIYVDGKNMFSGDALARSFAATVANLAEADKSLPVRFYEREAA